MKRFSRVLRLRTNLLFQKSVPVIEAAFASFEAHLKSIIIYYIYLFQLTFSRKVSQTTIQTKFDAKILHENPGMAAESGMVDDGQSAKEVYRVDNFDLVQVPEEDYGKFYSGDCYVILYAYNDGRRDCYLIYYWLVSIHVTPQK